MTNYPKIGIRPTIDGRQGGIREGLEEKTMNLAKAKPRNLHKECGENRIRTCEPVLPVTRFPGVPLQPLEHLSKKYFAVANLRLRLQRYEKT